MFRNVQQLQQANDLQLQFMEFRKMFMKSCGMQQLNTRRKRDITRRQEYSQALNAQTLEVTGQTIKRSNPRRRQYEFSVHLWRHAIVSTVHYYVVMDFESSIIF